MTRDLLTYIGMTLKSIVKFFTYHGISIKMSKINIILDLLLTNIPPGNLLINLQIANATLKSLNRWEYWAIWNAVEWFQQKSIQENFILLEENLLWRNGKWLLDDISLKTLYGKPPRNDRINQDTKSRLYPYGFPLFTEISYEK